MVKQLYHEVINIVSLLRNHMNKIILGLLAVCALGIGLVMASFASSSDSSLENGLPFVSPASVVPVSGEVQEVYLKALNTGLYDKQEIRVKKGIPVVLHFSAEAQSGCGKQLFVPEFGVRLVSAKGEEATATFTPSKAGVFAYRCGMNMFRGKMVVE